MMFRFFRYIPLRSILKIYTEILLDCLKLIMFNMRLFFPIISIITVSYNRHISNLSCNSA